MRKITNRKALVELRIGNHKLMIESGRYDQITRENRLCPSYRSNQLKTKLTSFSTALNFLFQEKNKVQLYVHNINQLPAIEVIKELMNSSNYFVTKVFNC